MKHVMLDLETLGTAADSVILSIGAVKFDLTSDAVDDNGFYASVSIDSNLDAGRRIDESTLIWWMQQAPGAQRVFHEPKEPLDAALESLEEWFDGAEYVWSNGAGFDIPMLTHAYKRYGMDTPWQFYNTRCVRTYKSLPSSGKVPKPVNDHNALRDALNQARYVQAIHKTLKG